MRRFKIIVATLLAGAALCTGLMIFNQKEVDDQAPTTLREPVGYSTDSAALDIVYVDHKASHAERISRKSSVQVHHPDFRGFGSGTYFKLKNRHFILTAAHVVRDMNYMMVSGRDELVPGRVVYTNPASDIAILEVDKMNTRTPVKFRINHDPHVGDSLAYTGFPNGTDLLTITGRVSGYRGRWLVVQSYIWMGASGSGVFDSQGRLIGVVSMVEIGNFRFPQVIEDVGYIAKISEEDEKKIREL